MTDANAPRFPGGCHLLAPFGPINGEWRLLNAHIFEPEQLTHQQWIFSSDVFCPMPQQNKGKSPAFQRSGGCRLGNASWGYRRPWLGHRQASAKTVVGLIENVLSLALAGRSRANPVPQPFRAAVPNSNPTFPARARRSRAVSGRARRPRVTDRSPRTSFDSARGQNCSGG